MNRYCLQLRSITLALALGLSVLMAGCATTGSCELEASSPPSDLEGKWSWKQSLGGPGSESLWEGEFVLKEDGDSYSGTLDDTREGTYGDTVRDVILSEDLIKFTRDGRFGAQYWKGKLIEQDGVLKIVNGVWTKEGGGSGSWYAERID